MQVVIRSYSQLYKELEVLKRQIEQFRQQHARLSPGSTEHIALEVTIASLMVEFCKLQKEMLVAKSRLQY